MRNVDYNTFAETVLVLLFAGIGLSTLIRLLLPTKSFRRTLINHFISKIAHDLFSFRREFLANVPRLRQVRFFYFFPNLLLRMRRNGQSCPSGINTVQN